MLVHLGRSCPNWLPRLLIQLYLQRLPIVIDGAVVELRLRVYNIPSLYSFSHVLTKQALLVRLEEPISHSCCFH